MIERCEGFEEGLSTSSEKQQPNAEKHETLVIRLYFLFLKDLYRAL